MSLSTFFGFRTLSSSNDELPEIFPLAIVQSEFVSIDIQTIYAKILTDVVERTQGIPDEVFPLLWDNCLKSEAPDGLITLLSCAMMEKKDLFLVFNKAVNVLRMATGQEASQIKKDYETLGSSPLGIFVSFKHYRRTDMVRIYSAMEYCVISSLNKSSNLSKAIQFKMSEMRSSVSLTDSSVAIEQAKSIARSLSNGRDVMLDKNDEIATSTPDISSIKESIQFLDSKRAFYYGMPLSYINGEQTPGIGSTGEADTRAVERGLKQYYISILKPVLEALFEIDTSFKSNDFRQINSALEALKTFELIGNDMISQDQKQLVVQRLLDLDEEVGQ